MTQKNTSIIGTTAFVDFIHRSIPSPVPARVDSGARTSSVWASNIKKHNSEVRFCLFDTGHPDFTGEIIQLPIIDKRDVRSSMGTVEYRYVVELEVEVEGKHMLSEFTLADRSKQRYPILLGRNLLANNFLIDCSLPGSALHADDTEEFDDEGGES